MMQNGFLVLENGSVYSGRGFRSTKTEISIGEVVFNTSHTGYEEIATDPSYHHQILIMTQPMQGQYGANREVWESSRIWIRGFVCLEMQKGERERSWCETLLRGECPILTEIDTRRLVLEIRRAGTLRGGVSFESTPERAASSVLSALKHSVADEDLDWAWQASRKNLEVLEGQVGQGQRVAVIDFGCKENILRELVKRTKEVGVFPCRSSYQEVMDWGPDRILLSNGPGDPEQVQGAASLVREFIGRVPVMGICMGHQILARALGAKTYRLKFGHRGGNHPIKDLISERIYMSSQNHGYAVEAETLPSRVSVTHWNLNDQTVEGFESRRDRCLGIQFHPECHPGPREALSVFDYFLESL